MYDGGGACSLDICKDLVQSDRFPKEIGAVWEKGRMEKERIIQDARNMFMNHYRSDLGHFLLRNLYISFVLKKTICTLNLHIVHAGVLISFCCSSFFIFIFLLFGLG